MDPTSDAVFTQDPVLDGSVEPAPPNPVPHIPPQPEVITKAIHNNARHRMTAKKPVVIQRCEICNIELIGQVVIDAHMKGSKHAKKLKAKELLNNLIGAGQIRVDSNQKDKPGTFKCDLCNVVLNSTQQLEVHYAGAKHKAKAEGGGGQQVPDGSGGEPPVAGSGEATGHSTSAEKPKPIAANPLDLVCTVCKITVNSPQQLEQHLNSKKHQDRESGRTSHRPSPYSRGGRGGRGGLGSSSQGPGQGRGGGGGGKAASSKFTSLSNSFTSGGYNNSFIKPEGGVIMPMPQKQQQGPHHPHHPQQQQQQHAAKSSSNFGGGGHYNKNRPDFGSLTPYVNSDGGGGRGGYGGRGGGGGGLPRGGWVGGGVLGGGGPMNTPAAAQQGGQGAAVAPQTGYGAYDYEQYGYGYGYTGYENAEGYGYGMMPSGPPPTF